MNTITGMFNNTSINTHFWEANAHEIKMVLLGDNRSYGDSNVNTSQCRPIERHAKAFEKFEQGSDVPSQTVMYGGHRNFGT